MVASGTSESIVIATIIPTVLCATCKRWDIKQVI